MAKQRVRVPVFYGSEKCQCCVLSALSNRTKTTSTTRSFDFICIPFYCFRVYQAGFSGEFAIRNLACIELALRKEQQCRRWNEDGWFFMFFLSAVSKMTCWTGFSKRNIGRAVSEFRSFQYLSYLEDPLLSFFKYFLNLLVLYRSSTPWWRHCLRL